MLKKLIDTAGYNALVQAKYGYMLYNKNDLYIGRAIETYGEYSESEVSLFRQICSQGDVVVEVGANIGAHTLVFAQLVGSGGRVYAFEPQRVVFQTLCANMALNSLTNVECYQMAASSEDGFVFLPDVHYDQTGNFGGIEISQSETGNRVPAVKLDDFLNVPRLRLLKVDVEGMESEVIAGAVRLIDRHKPILYVENDRLEKSKQLIELIWSLDCKAYWHLASLFSPDNYAGNIQNLYPGIVSANMLCVPNSLNLTVQGLTEIVDAGFHPLRRTPAPGQHPV